MSHDLNFAARRPGAVIRSELESFLTSSSARFEQHPTADGVQFFYQNKRTDVSFTIDYHEPRADAVAAHTAVYETGLSFNLNYNRPSYFALEAMPWVEKLCVAFDLLVVDPQGEQADADGAKACDVADLIASWDRSNAWAVGAIGREAGPMSVLSRSKSISVWQYMFHYDRLQELLMETAFVPKLYVLREDATGRLVTAITWTATIPALFPEVDIVMIGRLRKRFFGLKTEQEMVVIDYPSLMAVVGSHLDPVVDEVPNLKLLPDDRATHLHQTVCNIPLKRLDRNTFTRIRMDSFVDTQVD